MRKLAWILGAGVLAAASAVVTPGWRETVLYQCAATLAAIGCWWGAAQHEQPARRAWQLLALGVTLWVLGDLAWSVPAIADVAADGFSIADGLYLVGYPCVAAGILRLIRMPGEPDREGILDGMAFGAASAVALWALFVRPEIDTDTQPIAAMITAAYPLGDVLLVAGCVWLILSPALRTTSTRLLTAALGLSLAADILFATFDDQSGSQWFRWLNALYPLTYSLVAAASWSEAGDAKRGHDDAPLDGVEAIHRGRVALLGAALIAAPVGALVTASGAKLSDRLFLGLVTAIITAIVLGRFTMALNDRHRAQLALAHRATYDELTGALNRHSLLGVLHNQVTTPAKNVSLLYLDLDGLKRVNDQRGHAAGDVVIVEAFDRIAASVRGSDAIGRLGGDEFAVVCPGADPIDARSVADRILTAMQTSEPLTRYGVTVSIGLASQSPAVSWERLLNDADMAMYEAKRDGGNRISTQPQQPDAIVAR